MKTLVYKLNNRKESAITKMVIKIMEWTVSQNKEQKEKKMKMIGKMLKDVDIQHPSSKSWRVRGAKG